MSALELVNSSTIIRDNLKISQGLHRLLYCMYVQHVLYMLVILLKSHVSSPFVVKKCIYSFLLKGGNVFGDISEMILSLC